jgi:hypothetical protein
MEGCRGVKHAARFVRAFLACPTPESAAQFLGDPENSARSILPPAVAGEGRA